MYPDSEFIPGCLDFQLYQQDPLRLVMKQLSDLYRLGQCREVVVMHNELVAVFIIE